MLGLKAVIMDKFKLKNSKKWALLGGAFTGPFSNLSLILGATGGFAIGRIYDKIKERKLLKKQESLSSINLLRPKIEPKNIENLRKRLSKSSGNEFIKTRVKRF